MKSNQQKRYLIYKNKYLEYLAFETKGLKDVDWHIEKAALIRTKHMGKLNGPLKWVSMNSLTWGTTSFWGRYEKTEISENDVFLLLL